MATSKNKPPDFFADDPVEIATGPGARVKSSERPAHSRAARGMTPKARMGDGIKKKKVGFYISLDLLDRFSRRFYELKLAGIAIENKSALLERALSFALDDMDRGVKSRVLEDLAD